MYGRLGFALTVALAIASVPAVAQDQAAAAWKKGNCKMCHGDDGSGSTPAGKAMGARDLRVPAVQKQTDVEIAKIVADGRKKMPAFKNKLSEKEIAAVVSCVRSLAQPAK
ncbi:MAG: cytochrome c [Thermoanaerobaculia bacterium]|nr:cytochrome c [Thermoanaerobaculia bacterium]